jgi:hypothetical protein
MELSKMHPAFTGGHRCIDGRIFKHMPQHDDPNYEQDVGECGDCGGKGCGTTVPANEDEAQRGLNDIFPGDPYPVLSILADIRQRSVQAVHAGISRRDWWATEIAANELRDRIDELIIRLRRSPSPSEIK